MLFFWTRRDPALGGSQPHRVPASRSASLTECQPGRERGLAFLSFLFKTDNEVPKAPLCFLGLNRVNVRGRRVRGSRPDRSGRRFWTEAAPTELEVTWRGLVSYIIK